MENVVRLPDVEILIGAASFEVAAICFYAREDVHQGYDVAIAVTSKNEVSVIRSVLQDALTALSSVDWKSLDELGAITSEASGEPPF